MVTLALQTVLPSMGLGPRLQWTSLLWTFGVHVRGNSTKSWEKRNGIAVIRRPECPLLESTITLPTPMKPVGVLGGANNGDGPPGWQWLWGKVKTDVS